MDRETAIGEFSTHNLYCAQAPTVIKRYVPNAKMIAILRNPAERAFSAFTRMVRANMASAAFYITVK